MSVHHPLDYNQAMNDPTEIRKRLLKFLVPVVLLAVGFNIPKFFETQAVMVPLVDPETNETDFTVVLNVTKMRVDPIYSSFVNWSTLFVLGAFVKAFFFFFFFCQIRFWKLDFLTRSQ